MLKLIGPADTITILNATLGFLAVLMLFINEQRLAFTLILLALLADGLDGIVARRLGKGAMGDYLEAMADMMSLSIAPLIFVFTIYTPTITGQPMLQISLIAISLFFLICAVIRLASFHILKETISFLGLPASVSAIFILILTSMYLNLEFILLVIVILAASMIIPVRFPKPGIAMNTVATVLIIITIIFYTAYDNLAGTLLMCALFIYTFIGPLVFYKKHESNNLKQDGFL